MRFLLVAGVLILGARVVVAEDVITVPWLELKQLYRESVAQEVRKQMDAKTGERQAQVYSFDDASYRIQIAQGRVEGVALISGKILRGGPEALPVFDGEPVITGIGRTSGGSLISSREGGVMFMPDGKTQEFQLELSFALKPQEDGVSRYVSLAVPTAVRNSLVLAMSNDVVLVEEPGIASASGVYHIPAAEPLVIRYQSRRSDSAAAAVDIDSISRVRLNGNKVVISTTYRPVRPVAAPVVVQAPSNSHFTASSLMASWIKKLGDGRYSVELPAGHKEPFGMQFALEPAGAPLSFQLPVVSGNGGSEGYVEIEQPDDGQIAASGKGLAAVQPDRVPAGLSDGKRVCQRLPAGEQLDLIITRFESVNTPASVLGTQHFYAAFEENGNVLGTLVLDLPRELGAHMKIKAVKGAGIWSLSVNGAKKSVYTDSDGNWVIPLAGAGSSHVELAFLVKGEKLGIQGRLETLIPAIGLPARSLNVGIALPARVDLMTLEGAVTSCQSANWILPADFVGKPYYFTRSFHQGDDLKLAVFYKEPVKEVGAR